MVIIDEKMKAGDVENSRGKATKKIVQ